jgi:enoyl-CoA hydratase/carnithine racemase
MQTLMTGEPITAQEAHRLGAVSEIHPRAGLMSAVLSIAEKIAGSSPTAVQAVKRAVQIGQGENEHC